MPIEQRGVDTIPEDERTSGPRDLISILLGSNLCLGVIVFGWLPPSFGLGLWPSVTAIVTGTLVGIAFTAPLALVSLRTATNLSTSSGAQFGVRGRLRGLGGGPAALARLHRADPVDRRRRDGGRPLAAHRTAGHGGHARPDVRRTRRVHRRRGRLRLPAAAAHEQDPGRRHGGAAGRRRLRLLRGLHHRGPAGHRVPARLVLADLDPRRRRRRAQRPGRLHHPARRLHPLHLPAAAQLPQGALGHRVRTALRPPDPAAVRHLHGARRPGRLPSTPARWWRPRPSGT